MLNSIIRFCNHEQRINEYWSLEGYYPANDYSITRMDRNIVDGQVQNKYSIQIFPVKFNPSLQTVKLYQRAVVKIYFTDLSSISGSAHSVQPAYQNSRSSFDPGQEVKYIILTTPSLVDELEVLAAWKIRAGLTTKIVDINSI